ncbi:MAG: MCE family protein [Actinobacteria bacterium]|nr:MCE family protein [Actinomycetota bacterium]
MRTILLRAVPLVVLVLLGGVLVARPGEDRVPVTATFADVRDLVPRASVRVADVPVGTVTAIELTSDHRARVTMSVAADTGLPADVVAVLRSTGVLGERYVELRALPGAPGPFRGGDLGTGEVVDDIEDVVASGSDLLAVVSADHLARALGVGATALDGRGPALGATLGDVGTLLGAYAEDREDLGRLVDATDRLLAELAPDARESAAVLADLDRAARAFDRQDERLFAALESLSRLADVAAAILVENGPSLDALLRRLHLAVAELTRVDGALHALLRWLPRHNLHVANGHIDEQSQVWGDVTVCGVHDEPDNPSNTCHPTTPGRSNEPPPGAGPDGCDLHHEGCRYPDGVSPNGPHGEPRDGGGP